MTSFRYQIIAALLLSAGALRAQSSPELREILDRLQKLEDANRDLVQEVHALRTELASVHNPAPAATAPTNADTAEQMAVDKARVDELAQTKVEASQKMPLRITGTVLFNSYVNGRYNGGTGNTTIASLTQGDATGGGTFRQTTFGLAYDGSQTVFGAAVSGWLDLDLFGGSANSLNELMRLRTAAISLDWQNTSLLFGQEKPIISPRDPTSLAQVGVSPLTGAGNLWLWQPQVRLEQRFSLGENTGIRVQAGVVQTRELGAEANGYNSYVPAPIAGLPVEHADPGVETRVELWRRWSDTRRVEIATGFHDNSSTVGTSSVPSRVYSVDWLLRPLDHLEFSGFLYTGQNVADLGALPQGFVFYDYHARAVQSDGGWAQIRIPVTQRLAFDFYGGVQNDRKSDLEAGYIGLNAGYFANAMYRIAPNVFLSLEAGQMRTTYLGTGIRLNNHYDLAVAYSF
jgi:hypothetical protein